MEAVMGFMTWPWTSHSVFPATSYLFYKSFLVQVGGKCSKAWIPGYRDHWGTSRGWLLWSPIKWMKLKNYLIHPSKFTSRLSKKLPIGMELSKRNYKRCQNNVTEVILRKLTGMDKISNYLESCKCCNRFYYVLPELLKSINMELVRT